MEKFQLIAPTLIFISVVVLIIYYWINERKKKAQRESDLNKLIQFLNTLQNKLEETTFQMKEKFELQEMGIKIVQEQMQKEYAKNHKEMYDKMIEIKNSFTENSTKFQELLSKNTHDNVEFKKQILIIKESIEREHASILKEIRTPLDID